MTEDTKTTDILNARPIDKGNMIVAGEIADLRFVDAKGKPIAGLSLRAGKMLHELINHAGPLVSKQNQRFKIDVSKINWLHGGAKEVEAIAYELAGTVICCDITINKKPARRFGAFLSDVILFDENAFELEYEFSPLVRAVFQVSNHWAALSAKAVYAFESSYSLRLYEILTLRSGLKYKNEETFSLEDFRLRMGVGFGKLKRWPDVRRKVLELAIDEINYLTGMIVDYEVSKRRRKVEFVTLRWRTKEGDELKEVEKRLNKTRAEQRSEKAGTIDAAKEDQRKRRALLAEELSKIQAGTEQARLDLDGDHIVY